MRSILLISLVAFVSLTNATTASQKKLSGLVNVDPLPAEKYPAEKYPTEKYPTEKYPVEQPAYPQPAYPTDKYAPEPQYKKPYSVDNEKYLEQIRRQESAETANYERQRANLIELQRKRDQEEFELRERRRLELLDAQLREYELEEKRYREAKRRFALEERDFHEAARRRQELQRELDLQRNAEEYVQQGKYGKKLVKKGKKSKYYRHGTPEDNTVYVQNVNDNRNANADKQVNGNANAIANSNEDTKEDIDFKQNNIDVDVDVDLRKYEGVPYGYNAYYAPYPGQPANGAYNGVEQRPYPVYPAYPQQRQPYY